MRAILTQKGLKIACPQRSSTDEMTLQRILKFLGTSPDEIRAEGGALPERQLRRYRRGLFRWPGGLPLCRAGPAGGDLHRDRARAAAPAKLVAFPADVRKHLIDTYAYAEGILPAGDLSRRCNRATCR